LSVLVLSGCDTGYNRADKIACEESGGLFHKACKSSIIIGTCSPGDVYYKCSCYGDQHLESSRCVNTPEDQLRQKCLDKNQPQTPEWKCALNNKRSCVCVNQNTGNEYFPWVSKADGGIR